MTSSSDSTSLLVSVSDTLTSLERQLIMDFSSQLPLTVTTAPPHSQDAPISSICIVAVVDGRGLACPLPLLKTKLALRGVKPGEAVYVVATDPNATADISAFCWQSHRQGAAASEQSTHLDLSLHHQSAAPAAPKSASLSSLASAKRADTFFHFIITKTDSN